MKINHFSQHSLSQFATLHGDLQELCHAVLPLWDIKISQGHRGQAEQDLAFLQGNTKVKWPNSKHNDSPSWGVDLFPYVEGKFIGWEGKDAMEHWFAFGGLVLGVAHRLRADGLMTRRLVWGGDWDGDWNFKEQKFDDLPHFELI